MIALPHSSARAECTDPNEDDFMGVEYDHDWWLWDAARIARNQALSELDAQHLMHLLEEIAQLRHIINQMMSSDLETLF